MNSQCKYFEIEFQNTNIGPDHQLPSGIKRYTNNDFTKKRHYYLQSKAKKLFQYFKIFLDDKFIDAGSDIKVTPDLDPEKE